MSPRFDVVVAASHLRYDGVWQRPQQVLSRIAQRVPVLFVEEQFAAPGDRDETIGHGNLTVLRPRRTSADFTTLDAMTVASVRTWLAGRRPLIWLYTPMLLALADAFPDAPIAYDCMDELAAFKFAPAAMREREAELLARATRVFTGGRSLYERRRAIGEKVMCFPSGVEFAHFARETPPHPLFARMERPIFGYFGVVDERIDLGVVDALAASAAQLVLVGPTAKIDPAAIARRPNVHMTGQVSYASLPSFLAGFDVAIMPFALSESTAFISPTKTPEYLAAGKPVVSTAIADVVAEYADCVTVASEPSGFVDACFASMSPDRERSERGIERARAAGWEKTVDRMWEALGTT